jgi:hypothetical protein
VWGCAGEAGKGWDSRSCAIAQRRKAAYTPETQMQRRNNPIVRGAVEAGKGLSGRVAEESEVRSVEGAC